MRAEQVKQLVPLESLVNRLGYEPNRAGFISCPAHSDSTPSLKIYDGDKGWYCFGCNQGGTVIDFYMHVMQVDFRTALNAIGQMYGLVDEQLTRARRVEIARSKAKHKKRNYLEEQAKEWYDKWCRYKAILEQDHDDWNPLLEEACANISYAEYRYQELQERMEAEDGNKHSR